jgi:hypothetical protein
MHERGKKKKGKRKKPHLAVFLTRRRIYALSVLIQNKPPLRFLSAARNPETMHPVHYISIASGKSIEKTHSGAPPFLFCSYFAKLIITVFDTGHGA